MAESSGKASVSNNTSAYREDNRDVGFHSKHTIFLSHSGAQKDFVEQLCVDLERWDRQPFFDKRRDSLPIGENFPEHIFEAIRQCQVGVVILSEEFFTRSKWPMIELVAMVRKAKRRELGFKIFPVFLGMSIDAFCDPEKRNGWLSCWYELVLNDKRIDVQEWEGALKHLEPLKSLVYDGMGEVMFRREIVDVLCGAVRLETRLEDSHIQGRARLCELIQGRISKLEDEKKEGLLLVGLYGMGGIGKTSISKALCNEYITRFHGRVCHAELERKSREGLLREVLKTLTDTSRDVLDNWNEGQLLQKLNEGIIKEPVFLVVDNVSDVPASIDEAKQYVLEQLPLGSIVMLTSRSKETLKHVRRNLVDNNIMEMPELDVEEAKSLFCRSYQMDLGCEVNEGVVRRCVKRCYFKKGDGHDSYHYHPLALDVLGRQLAYIEVEEWEAHLDRIDKDIFNQSGEVEHQVFSILRKSYDMLAPNDQLLFMDVALLLPFRVKRFPYQAQYKVNTHEWLGMVHTISVDDVISRLKGLRRKSLLENLGDGVEISIGMHDLWRAFCKVEVKSGELNCRRWMYEAKGYLELVERYTAGGCWENVARALLHFDVDDLERVNFSHFPNVTILNVAEYSLKEELVLDLCGLGCLKSLDIQVYQPDRLVLLGLPRCIVFLRLGSILWRSGPWDEVVKGGYLTKLEHLELLGYEGDKLPDMGSMVSLRVAIFIQCNNVVTLTGLSTKLSNLRVLHFIQCFQLHSCPGVGDLVELETLNFGKCHSLECLPSLGKLRNLRKFDMYGCPLIKEVLGLGDLVALEELRMGDDLHISSYFDHLYSLDVSKLRKLRILRLTWCRLVALPGFHSLVSLEDVNVKFQDVVVKPCLGQLTKLQALKIPHGWDLERLKELNNFVMLHDLEIGSCYDVDNLPDIQGLISLQTLTIQDCGFKSVGGLSNVTTLESLAISGCRRLERLPDLQGLIILKQLMIVDCHAMRKWDWKMGATAGSLCPSIDDSVGSKVLNSWMPMGLETLELSWCPVFEDVMVLEAFSKLQNLKYHSLEATIELPDLRCFPQLKTLSLFKCTRLRRVTIREPIHALTTIEIGGCSNLMTLPDLINFPGLVKLVLHGCEGILRLNVSETLHSLRVLRVNKSCSNDCGMEELPDLGMFPALVKLILKGCSKLTFLKSSVPLPALECLNVRGCTSLSGADLDELQALCPQCEIKRDVI